MSCVIQKSVGVLTTYFIPIIQSLRKQQARAKAEALIIALNKTHIDNTRLLTPSPKLSIEVGNMTMAWALAQSAKWVCTWPLPEAKAL